MVMQITAAAKISPGQKGRAQSSMENEPNSKPVLPMSAETVPVSAVSCRIIKTVDGGRMALLAKVTGAKQSANHHGPQPPTQSITAPLHAMQRKHPVMKRR